MDILGAFEAVWVVRVVQFHDAQARSSIQGLVDRCPYNISTAGTTSSAIRLCKPFSRSRLPSLRFSAKTNPILRLYCIAYRNCDILHHLQLSNCQTETRNPPLTSSPITVARPTSQTSFALSIVVTERLSHRTVCRTRNRDWARRTFLTWQLAARERFPPRTTDRKVRSSRGRTITTRIGTATPIVHFATWIIQDPIKVNSSKSTIIETNLEPLKRGRESCQLDCSRSIEQSG